MTSTTVNIGRLLDERPINGFQKFVVFLCALVALLDGFDTQSIGFAAPALAGALHLAPGAIGTVFSAGLLGAMLGAAIFGAVCDRFGRKRPLIFATLLFAAFSLATIWVDAAWQLVACRFLAGLGLGGATPSFIALASEFVATRRRSVTVAVLWAGFPLGGMIGGFSSSWLIPNFGWHAVFVVGGILPLLVAAVLAVWLPDSLRFLIAHRDDQAQAVAIMRRLAPDLPPATYEVDEEQITGTSVAALFRNGRAATTLLLWVPFFLVFMMLAVIVLWTPSLMRQMGLTAATGAMLIGANNLGSVFGTASAGALLDRYSPYPVLAVAYVLGGLCLVPIGWLSGDPGLMAVCLILNGVCLGAGGGGTIVLAARTYPTLMRSTGVGWGMAMGRFGQVVGPFVAGAMVADGLTARAIFISLFVASIIASIAVMLLKLATAARGATAAEGALV
jgi:MFS transporter, AAHS family, 4-hydroxybenzoate transporter